MKVHNVEQNTLDWLKLHIGIPTASGFDNVVTPEFEIRKGEMPKTYICKKLAESWREQPLVSLNNNGGFSCEQGLIIEEEARPFFELETNRPVSQVGFITTDDDRCGCSPDGMIGDNTGLEIKCPEAHTHVKYLLNGVLPKEYAVQVHFSLFVTGFQQWMFMSYRRKFPPLIVEVKRDEAIIAKITDAVDKFYEDFNQAKEQIEGFSK